MAPSVGPFADALLAAPFHAMACPVLSGIGAEKIVDKARAAETLSRQLAETILWSECMDAAAEAGITVALELGPGAALSRMMQARHPQIACRSVADFRSLDGIVAWLGRHLDQMPMA
jgi:[acyl-carrier-protein] S-malonyltransferase